MILDAQMPPQFEQDGCFHEWEPYNLADYTWRCKGCQVLHKHVVEVIELNGEGGL